MQEKRKLVPEEERIMTGVLFSTADPELKAIKLRCHNLNLDYNRLYEHEEEKRQEILTRILGGRGEHCFMQGPIFFHYGQHTTIGDYFFANFNFTVQDDAPVTIGEHCQFGPNVTIVTPNHPMVAEERTCILDKGGNPKGLCYARPVHIGDNCWFGANVVVCPGVTIGNGCVIGAGSVVTKDIPDNSFAAGVPCRVVREITERDSMRHRPELLGGCIVP